ncbi:unnamed protein product [Clonostachys rosea f. rosea IK726]|uniref:DNA replication ATP-dependent helicase/nuclease n=2 Tax=Bionectria ochroleuca TaxID=29856 RepID=A0A0B7K6T7_BIOOC|nr:unnamed protein product [Clonostachys rosea f. rosea IK726]
MPLQKSYSEHLGYSRQRSTWQRSRSNPSNPQTPSSRPLQPISDTTKKKLNKFIYQSEKEDASSAGRTDSPVDRQLPSEEAGNGRYVTPKPRLSWKDFVNPTGSPEEEAETSPNDRLMWDNRLESAKKPSPMSRRKKRARSSSPVSSPSFDKTPAVNVKKLKEALKSPHADPTLELWDRYSLNKSESPSTSAIGAMNPTLAQLMISSSPRPSNGPRRGEGSLRRSMSHGLQCPKRRKVENSRSFNVAGDEQREMEAASKYSMVSALLDTVSGSMQDRSSPDNERQVPDSPSPSKRPASARQDKSPSRSKQGNFETEDVSDYGDDDFDEDTFLELEATITATQALKADKAPEIPISGTDVSDEFGDLDDDVFEEAANLVPALSQKNPQNDHKTLVSQRPGGVASGANANIEEFDDEEFGDLDDDLDFDAIELAATQSVNQSTQPKNPSRGLITPTGGKSKTIQRYLVTKVLDGEFVDDSGTTQIEKVLLIKAENSKIYRTVLLRGSWYDTPVHAEAYVHIIGQFSEKGQCIIDDLQNLLILHPDQLISSTVVADSYGCMRRAVLQDRVKATSEPSPPLVYGTLLHEIFQAALLANQWSRGFLSKTIETVMEKHVEDLYTIKVSMAVAREHLESKMAGLASWASSFVSSQPNVDALVEDRRGSKAQMALTKLLDVEEHVWSPMYGLKGNIDATVEVKIQDGPKQRTLTVPFELKTGRNSNSNHMIQTSLYTMLLSDRYDIDIACGILYYMETSKTLRIPAIAHELRHMVMQRNELACHIRERSIQLPTMLKNKRMCGNCYAKTSCFIYHRLADDGDGKTSGMDQKFDEVVKHLSTRHQEFFIKWDNLITKEEKESQKMKRELWTMTSAEREKKSRCFSDVIIEPGSASIDADIPRINRFHYTFIKREHVPGFSFLESELSTGEPVVVSDEEGHFALAIGYITAVRKDRVSVAVDRRLHNARIRQPGFDEVDNQVFAGIMEAQLGASSQGEARGKDEVPPIRYRLDQDEFSNGMATVRNNLVQMMADDIPHARRMRQVIVDMEPPRFKPVATQYTVTDGDSLNVDQKQAIEKVMSAQDYALVLGMPGTGKTTTIAHIIRALASQGKSVLLTSHTHTAVDNILLKLKSDNTPILRLGVPSKVHPEVKEFATLAGLPMKSYEQIKEAWHESPIVATTCLGINHPVFHERSFDYCIVDEASQITLPICAGPIRMARTFVLVGDHNQLPPVVKNEEAREGGLDVSLFKLLSDAHPESVVNLEHQYRMCEDIMTLSNTLIYDGRLRCGTESLRKRKLDIPKMEALKLKHFDSASLRLAGTPRSICTGPVPGRCWLSDVLDSEARVRFLDTDTIQPLVREEAQGKRIVNSAECRVVSQLVDSLLSIGIPSNEIGVMTHYRAQLFMLKDQLRGFHGVEMHTTDRFQGRDKEVIVLSLVRSNDACNIGDLLKDWRRINVAFTRAKTKLLVVGSMSTLKGSGQENMLSRFISLMEDHDWIYHLPAEALVNHHFEEFGTQITASGLTQRNGPSPTKPKKSPKKIIGGPKGKENMRPSPKKAKIGERLMKTKPIIRDILNEMTNGAY